MPRKPLPKFGALPVVIAASVFAFLPLCSATAWAEIPVAALNTTTAGGVPSLAPILKGVLPAVVNISVTGKMEVQNPLLADPMFRQFFNIPDQPQSRAFQSIGSGVIVDAAKGYIVTNNHVVDKADKIKVFLNDDEEFDAKLIGKDPDTDLAVLQIHAANLHSLPFADSEQVQVGDFVVAVGSPFNLKQTVTSGIISGLGRESDLGGYQDFIQTDASINPGNSGGGLVNLKGELVGINSQILSSSGGSNGIGFAIPTDIVKSVMNQLIQYGSVHRGLIGISGQPLTPDLAKEFGVPDGHGALVNRVIAGSPADKAGIKNGDVIVSVNGKDIKSFSQLRTIVGLMNVGDKVDLQILREGKARPISVIIGKKDDVQPKSGDDKDQGNTPVDTGLSPLLKGGTFAPSSGAGDNKGMRIVTIAPNSPLAETGLQSDDVILSVNRHRVTSIEEFRKFASAKESQLVLYVVRGNNAAFYLVLQQ